VKAQLTVLPDLAPELRHGVLAEPGKTWQAWMRLSIFRYIVHMCFPTQWQFTKTSVLQHLFL
jgi:hypothetical protein